MSESTKSSSCIDESIKAPLLDIIRQTIWKLRLVHSILPQRKVKTFPALKSSDSESSHVKSSGSTVPWEEEILEDETYNESNLENILTQIELHGDERDDIKIAKGLDEFASNLVEEQLILLEKELDSHLLNTKECSTQTDDDHKLWREKIPADCLFKSESVDDDEETELTADVLKEMSLRKLKQDLVFIEGMFQSLMEEIDVKCGFVQFEILVRQSKKSQNKKSEYIAMYHAQKWKARNLERSTRVRSIKLELDAYARETQLLVDEKEMEIIATLQDFDKLKVKLPMWKLQEKKISQVKKENQRFVLKDEELPIQERIDVLYREEPQELKAHLALARFLHKSIIELEITLRKWQERTLKDTQEKTETKKRVQERFDSKKGNLHALELKYSEYEAIVEEYLREKRLKELKMKEEEKLVTSAVKIQAWWRGIKVRMWGTVNALAARKKYVKRKNGSKAGPKK